MIDGVADGGVRGTDRTSAITGHVRLSASVRSGADAVSFGGHGLPIISREDALTLLTEAPPRSLTDVNLGNYRTIEIAGKQYPAKVIGSGGTKKVYEISLDTGEKKAVAVGAKDWKDVLQEPENTQRISNMGILTQGRMDIVPIQYEGRSFPAIVMTPYTEQQSFKVFDTKELWCSPTVPEKMRNVSSENEFVRLIDGIVQDAETLSRNGVSLAADNINFALMKGSDPQFRLFISDLPGEMSWTADPEAYPRLLRRNIESCVDSFTFVLRNANPENELIEDLRFDDDKFGTLVTEILHRLK